MSKLLGAASFLPERIVENGELSTSLGVSAEEIEARTGVRARRYADDGLGPSDLAAEAARSVLAQAGVSIEDVDFIVFATATPDVTFPGSACYLQEKLGCGTIGALDLRAQCTGFLVAIDVASQFVETDTYRRVLVAAGDVHSTSLDYSPRGAGATPLFGDGAAVALIGDGGDDLVASFFRTDPSELENFWCEFPSSRRLPLRMTVEDLSEGRHHPTVEAEAVRRDGREQVSQAIEEVCRRASVELGDVDRFVLHHVFPDVAEQVASSLGIVGKSSFGDRDIGHVVSASLPIAFCRARERGEIVDGSLVCLATAGSGANSGAVLLKVNA